MRRGMKLWTAARNGALFSVILLVALEGTGWLFNRAVYHVGYRQAAAQKKQFLARLPSTDTRTDADAGRRRFVDMAYGARYELHPYFGYTFFRDFASANNQGFFTDKSYPYRKSPREFVIGIFGGSVAMQVAGRSELLKQKLLPILRSKGYDAVTILPFAIGAWHQPQSFFAFVYYFDTIDMAIDLDGFNEATSLGPNQLRTYPARYPSIEVYPLLANRNVSPYEARDAATLSMTSDFAAWITRALARPPFKYSMLVHSVWRAFASQYDRYAASLRAHIAADSTEWAHIETDRSDGIVADKVEGYNRFYADLIRDADLIARAHGKPFFHFIQPNQYYRDAKPLSEEERTQYATNDWFDLVTSEYEKLETISDELRDGGIESESLARLFADVPATVYADACCHFNAAGLRMIDDAIAARVLSSEALERVKAADRTTTTDR